MQSAPKGTARDLSRRGASSRGSRARRRSRAAARSGRSSTATRARPARATTTAGARSSRQATEERLGARDDGDRGARQVDPLAATTRPTSASTSRSIPIAAASTAASTASRGRRTATSACRRGSTSRPGSSPRSTPPSGCARRFAARAYRPSADQHRLGDRRLPAGRAQARASRARCSRCWPSARIRSRSSPSRRASSATSTWSRRWRARGLAAVYVSVTTLDPALARILEPRAAAPHRRLRTIEALARAGVPVGVSVSPIIPFINEPEIERILEAAAAAGASSRVRHRAAPAVGGEPAVPALARPALSRPRRARHGAHPRDARRQGLRLDASARACAAKASGPS